MLFRSPSSPPAWTSLMAPQWSNRKIFPAAPPHHWTSSPSQPPHLIGEKPVKRSRHSLRRKRAPPVTVKKPDSDAKRCPTKSLISQRLFDDCLPVDQLTTPIFQDHSYPTSSPQPEASRPTTLDKWLQRGTGYFYFLRQNNAALTEQFLCNF